MKTRFSKIALLMFLVLALVVPMVAFNVSANDDVATASGETKITFNLGANGSASHYDPSSSKTTYSETVNGYKLSITAGNYMYPGARDAKGNSCIKFGTGSKAGSCTITVPDDVTSITIYVAAYKAKTATVKINNATTSLTKKSDNGEYDAITVDTSATKTVSFSVSSGYRAMLNTIVFNIPAQTSDCEHVFETDVINHATCTTDGSAINTCTLCGEKVDKVIPALGHKYDSGVVTTDPTCTEKGEMTYTCTVCDGEKVEAIPALGHDYVDGTCENCGQELPKTGDVTLSFATTDNRTLLTTSQQVWEQDLLVLTNDKASSTNNVVDNSNPARFYKGSKITIEHPGMTKIVFNCTSGYVITSEVIKAAVPDATVDTSGTKVTATFAEPIDSITIALTASQVRFSSIVVSYDISCKHGDVTVNTVDPTCTATGTKTTVCNDCGEIVEEITLEMIDHDYVDGVCTVCGEQNTETPIYPLENSKIHGASLELAGGISMFYRVTLADADGNYKMVFCVGEEVIEVTETTVVGENTYFVLKNISPEKMAYLVDAALYVENLNGNFDEVAALEGYSVKAYCEAMLEMIANKSIEGYTDEQYAALKQLLTNILAYGKAAQDYTDDLTGGYANEGVDNIGTATEEKPTEQDNVKSNVKGDSYNGDNLVVQAGIRFSANNKLYLTLKNTENITVKVNGAELVAYGNTYYTEDILATEFDKAIIFEIYVGDVLAQTVTYSINSYVYAVMNNANENAALAIALYNYGLAAQAYADAITQ